MKHQQYLSSKSKIIMRSQSSSPVQDTHCTVHVRGTPWWPESSKETLTVHTVGHEIDVEEVLQRVVEECNEWPGWADTGRLEIVRGEDVMGVKDVLRSGEIVTVRRTSGTLKKDVYLSTYTYATFGYYNILNPLRVAAFLGRHVDRSHVCYYGRSEVTRRVFRLVDLEPGDQIHSLCGGVYAVRPGQWTLPLKNGVLLAAEDADCCPRPHKQPYVAHDSLSNDPYVAKGAEVPLAGEEVKEDTW